MIDPCTTIFFGGPRDGELVPPELMDGRGTIDVPVYPDLRLDMMHDFGSTPSIDSGFKIRTYRRHRAIVRADPEPITDLWCPVEDDPERYFRELRRHVIKTRRKLAQLRRISPIFGTGPHGEDERDGTLFTRKEEP